MKIPAIITAAMIAAAPVAAAQVPDNDPALQQVVGADEQVAPLGERETSCGNKPYLRSRQLPLILDHG